MNRDFHRVADRSIFLIPEINGVPINPHLHTILIFSQTSYSITHLTNKPSKIHIISDRIQIHRRCHLNLSLDTRIHTVMENSSLSLSLWHWRFFLFSYYFNSVLIFCTYQLLTWRIVKPVSCASCFFCSSEGYGCCKKQRRHLWHRLWFRCWGVRLQSLMQCYAEVENKPLDSQFSYQLLWNSFYMSVILHGECSQSFNWFIFWIFTNEVF